MNVKLVEQVYQQYQKEIYIYLLGLSHNPWMAEDILQEVFVKAICSLPDSHMNIRAWLYKVAKNVYLNEIKKMNRNTSIEDFENYVEESGEENPVLDFLVREEKEKEMLIGILQ